MGRGGDENIVQHLDEEAEKFARPRLDEPHPYRILGARRARKCFELEGTADQPAAALAEADTPSQLDWAMFLPRFALLFGTHRRPIASRDLSDACCLDRASLLERMLIRL
jgi:hypothetical protein